MIPFAWHGSDHVQIRGIPVLTPPTPPKQDRHGPAGANSAEEIIGTEPGPSLGRAVGGRGTAGLQVGAGEVRTGHRVKLLPRGDAGPEAQAAGAGGGGGGGRLRRSHPRRFPGPERT